MTQKDKQTSRIEPLSKQWEHRLLTTRLTYRFTYDKKGKDKI